MLSAHIMLSLFPSSTFWLFNIKLNNWHGKFFLHRFVHRQPQHINALPMYQRTSSFCCCVLYMAYCELCNKFLHYELCVYLGGYCENISLGWFFYASTCFFCCQFAFDFMFSWWLNSHCECDENNNNKSASITIHLIFYFSISNFLAI